MVHLKDGRVFELPIKDYVPQWSEDLVKEVKVVTAMPNADAASSAAGPTPVAVAWESSQEALISFGPSEIPRP